MKHWLFTVIWCAVPMLVMGQHTYLKERPAWVDGYHKDLTNSYIEVVSGTGYSEDDARSNAINQIAGNRSLATGRQFHIRESGGNIVFESNDNLAVKCRIVDEYRVRLAPGEYRVSLLVQVAKHPELNYDPVNITDRYPFSARAFVPGMAQLYKGSTVKGVLFIAGEVVAIGGIVTFESLRSSYKSKIGRTHDVNLIENYADKSRQYANIRNGFIAGAVAIYVWNFIDGAVAKGKKHIEAGSANMQFTPYASTESAGIMLSMRF